MMSRMIDAQETLATLDSSKKGLFLQVPLKDVPSKNNFIQKINFAEPKEWETFDKRFYHHDKIKIFLMGHIYAKNADSFDFSETAEILLNSYREKGIEGLRQEIGGGMYSLIIIDFKNQKLFSFCDLLACFPLFYAKSTENITIATNQLDFEETTDLNEIAIFEYLSYGYLPFSDSLLNGVKRLGPGQLISIDFSKNITFDVSDERFPSYPHISERETNIENAVNMVSKALDRFFSRIGNKTVAAGLSGGYDSRLIAAYVKDNNPWFVTFNYPDTEETRLAIQVAKRLKNTTHPFDIPPNAPSKYINDFLYGMQTLDNLGTSHVFALLDKLQEEKSDFIIDGFLGDTIIGGGYYYKLFNGIEPTLKILVSKDNYHKKIHDVETYINVCFSAYGRASFDAEDFYLSKHSDVFKSLRNFVDKQVSSCYSHADMIEMLLYRIRGRCVISCGPVTFLRKRNTLFPYYDTDVFTACMAISKSIRAGDMLYNALWRYKFPDLCDIPKENTGGTANQSNFVYRVNHLSNAVGRKIRAMLPSGVCSMMQAGGNLSNFTKAYLNNEENIELFNSANEKVIKMIQRTESDRLKKIFESNNRNEKELLNKISLSFLLNELI